MDRIDRRLLASEKCATAFGTMFKGFISFLDFNLGSRQVRIDLLPEVLGWGMVSGALAKIHHLSPEVPPLRKLAARLTFLSLFDIVKVSVPVRGAAEVKLWLSPVVPITLVKTLLNIIFIWKFCGLLAAIGEETGEPRIWQRAYSCRTIFAFSQLFSLACFTAVFTEIPYVSVFLAVCVLLLLLGYLLLWSVCKRTQKLCRNLTLARTRRTHAPVGPAAMARCVGASQGGQSAAD